METYILYGVTILFLIVSYFKDKGKTKMALIKAWKAFENILPEFLVVLILVGLMLAILEPEVISKLIGSESGWFGTIIAAVVGSLVLIPGFVAFPTADLLLRNGAGLVQIAAFVSTLMMVGVITLPVEIKYFGKKTSLLRNGIGFFFCFLVAIIVGMVVG